MRKLLPTLLLGFTFSVPALAKPDIESLLHQMTLEEKLGQMQQMAGFGEVTGPGARAEEAKQTALIRAGKVGSILNTVGANQTNRLQKVAVEQSRLHVPILFGYDTIHGHRTIFPVPLGESASWDREGCEEAAAVAADEAYSTGVRWVFAPMVDIARDPRWGRVVEGSGEDPYLGSALAAARVRGFQRNDRVAACTKHWAGYGRVEAGREYNSVDVSERTLREVVFPPFKATVDAGVMTFMTAFNDLNGIPATASHYLMTEVLKGEWRFPGFIVSDWDAVQELRNHEVAADGREAARVSANAGLDMEMNSEHIASNGAALVAAGQLPLTRIDDAVRRILVIKQRLGLFDHPYVDEAAEKGSLFDPRHRALARRSAARSLVLLRNEGHLLPLSKSLKSILVLGPLADSGEDMIGPWHGQGRGNEAVGLAAGIRHQVPGCQVTVLKGCGFSERESLDRPAVEQALKGADVVVLAVGESADMSGEAHSRSRIDLPGQQLELFRLARASGKPVVVTLFNGRPLTLGEVADTPALLECWFPGSEGGNAVADVLFGDVNPAGKLPMTFPRVLGQVPIYYAHRNTGRPFGLRPDYVSAYLDVSNEPQFPFGYGLSYTSFQISAPSVAADQKSATVVVQNTGKLAGDEVVQLYLHRPSASVTRPVRQLIGFERLSLQPGQSKTVQFKLDASVLGFLDGALKPVVEPGPLELYAGDSSQASARTSIRLATP